jgi:putative transposase
MHYTLARLLQSMESMPRRSGPKSGQCAHITFRCNNKSFLLNLAKNWDVIVSWLNCLPFFFSVSLHHVLVMSNHFHLLLTPTKDNFPQALGYFLTNLSKYFNSHDNRKDHFFGNRYYPTIISDEKHLINVIRYIYQNPYRAKITKDILSYPYSSLGFYLGINNYGLKLYPDSFTKTLFNTYLVSGLLYWVDEIKRAIPEGDVRMIRKSLARGSYRYSQEQLRILKFYNSELL